MSMSWSKLGRISACVVSLMAAGCLFTSEEVAPDDPKALDMGGLAPDATEDLALDVPEDLAGAYASMDAGDAPSVDQAPACAPACTGVTPVCLSDGSACVECVEDADCAATPSTPICTDEHVCVACIEDIDCGGGLVCDPETSACVGCVEDTDCPAGVCDQGPSMCVECLGDDDCPDEGFGLCDMESFTCVECIGDDACTDPSLAQCSDTNTCVPCKTAAACTGPDEQQCLEGVCVGCTPETEEQDCGPNACDPVALECTSTARASLSTCQACRSDTECPANHGCVDMEYRGAVHGSYCLPDGKVLGMCLAPYRVPLQNKASRSGTVSDWCGVNESLTTCEAVRQRTTSTMACATDMDCGAPMLDDAVCVRESVIGRRCTYPCSNALQCDGTTEVCADQLIDGTSLRVCAPK